MKFFIKKVAIFIFLLLSNHLISKVNACHFNLAKFTLEITCSQLKVDINWTDYRPEFRCGASKLIRFDSSSQTILFSSFISDTTTSLVFSNLDTGNYSVSIFSEFDSCYFSGRFFRFQPDSTKTPFFFINGTNETYREICPDTNLWMKINNQACIGSYSYKIYESNNVGNYLNNGCIYTSNTYTNKPIIDFNLKSIPSIPSCLFMIGKFYTIELLTSSPLIVTKKTIFIKNTSTDSIITHGWWGVVSPGNLPVKINWRFENSALDINKEFEIENSINNSTWIKLGCVHATRITSNFSPNTFEFDIYHPNISVNTLNYRVKNCCSNKWVTSNYQPTLQGIIFSDLVLPMDYEPFDVKNNNVSVFPNPFESTLNIKIINSNFPIKKFVKIIIQSTLNSEIKFDSIYGFSELDNTLTLNTSDWQNGSYICFIFDNEGVISRTIIK